MTNRSVLYRIFSEDGELLYVGATTNPAQRFSDHSHHQPWWDEADRITLQRYGSIEELMEAESEAIRTEEPRFNYAGTQKPRPWAFKKRRAYGEGSLFQRADGMWIGRVELPPVDGKRRAKVVSSKDRETAERKLKQALSEMGHVYNGEYSK